MVYKQVPKGYYGKEFPLPHSFEHNFSLSAEDETKNSVVIPFFRYTEANNAPSGVLANPSNAAFSEDQGTSVHPDSIIPRLSLSINISLTKAAIQTDKVEMMKIHLIPMYFAFVNTLEASDIRTAIDIEAIMECTHATNNKDVIPLYSTVDLDLGDTSTDASNMPMSTIGHTETFADYALGTNLVLESVAFDEELFFDTRQFGSNAPMLRKVCPNLNSITIGRSGFKGPYEMFSNNFTRSMVKRSNPFTFCGMMVHVPQMSSADQIGNPADTTAIPHLNIAMRVRFDEWNATFNQDAF